MKSIVTSLEKVRVTCEIPDEKSVAVPIALKWPPLRASADSVIGEGRLLPLHSEVFGLRVRSPVIGLKSSVITS